MKKLKLFILGLLLIAAGGIQTTNAQSLSFGLKGGLSASNYKVSGYGNGVDNDLGITLGASLRVKLLLLSVTPEINYTRSKYSFTNPAILGGTGASVTNHSVDMPIVAGVTILKLLTLEAGPRFSLYDEAKTKINGDKVSLGATSADVGYLVGVRVNLPIISVGVRFNGQFKGYETNFNGYAPSMREINNNSTSLYVSFKM